MARNPALESLIRSLKDADSAFERMHALGLAWRSIRSLTPAERKTLARHAGFDGAQELIEKLALHRGGIAPAILLEAIQEARRARPQRLKSIFASLREPGTRKATLLKAVDAVARRLSEDEDPGGMEQAPDEEISPKAEDETSEGLIADIPEDLRPLLAVSEPEVVEKTGQDEALTETSGAASTEESPEKVDEAGENLSPESPIAHPAEEETREDASAEVGEDFVETLEEGGNSSEAVDHEQAPENSQEISPGPGPADRLEKASSLIARFRVLSTLEGRISNERDLRRIIEAFPPGWAQRRALLQLIRENQISEAEMALDVFREVSGRHNQRWLLHEIAARWEIEPGEAHGL